jgi:release factor glutamine methyltransferase
MTVLEAIQRSTEFLVRKGVESPRLQSENLLAHVLKLPRLQLYLQFDQVLSDENAAVLRELVVRRGRREPLQHLVGTTVFCGAELVVNRAVLVPRPETELLAEKAWLHLEQSQVETPLVLDFGTGSGCLAIAIALHCTRARVHASDVSAEALEVALTNARRHALADRIQFHCGDAFVGLPAGVAFDLIVANPPYIASPEIQSLEPEVRDHDPILALDGGADGLHFYRRLAAEAPSWLAPDGWLFVELGDDQALRVSELFRGHNWVVAGIDPDYSGRPRILGARRG